MSTQDLANYMENNGHGGWSNNKSKITYDVSSLDRDNQDIFHQAFERWDEILKKDFQSVTGNGEDITVKSADLGGTPGYANKSTITINTPTLDNAGNQGHTTGEYATLLHEIGHALGLYHPGPYNGSGTSFSDAKFSDDSNKKTVMSYFNQTQNPNVHDNAQASPITPQIADIVAAKSIYGLDSNTRDGNTVYGYDDYLTVGENSNGFPGGGFDKNDPEFITASPAESLDPDSNHSPFNPSEWNGNNASFTIYDGGGTDIIDMSSASSDQMITLNPGQFSSVGGVSDVRNDSAGEHPDQNINPAIANNMTIAPGVTIEQAVGGSGDDILFGNGANNTLAGYKGDDWLRGKGGDDTFVYQAGGDIDPADAIDGSVGHDRIFFAGNANYDIRDMDKNTIDSIEEITTEYDAQITLKSSQVMEEESTLEIITWNYLHDNPRSFNTTVKMTGDELDLSEWSFENYTQRKNEDFDNLKQVIKVEGQDSDQSIQTTNLSDRIVTGKGANDVSAGAGDDLVITSGSETLNDALDGGDGEDTIDFSSEDFSNATIDLSDDNGMTYPNWLETEPHSIFGNNNNPRYQPLNNFENVKGSAGANTILGDDGPNQLNGNAGADVLQPGKGTDELTGGASEDEFFFEPKTGPDNTITDFESGADVLNLSAFDFTDFGEVKNIATEVSDGLELTLNTRQETHKFYKEDPFPHVETETHIEEDKVKLMGMTKSDLDPSDVYLTADDPTDQDPFNTTPIGTIGTDFSDISI